MRFRDRRLLTLLLVALASVAALALSACGGGDSGDAKALLSDGFKKPIPKATVSVDLQIKAQGSQQLAQPVSFKLTGPYDFSNPTQPKSDWDLNASGGGASLGAKLLLTGDNAFINARGQNYEVGQEAWKAQIQQTIAGLAQVRSQTGKAKLDPASWLKDPKEDGDEDVAGTATTKVTGNVDLIKMITDLNKVAAQSQGGKTPAPTQQQIDQFKQIIKDPKLEVFVAKDDKTIRKAVVTLNFTIPESQRQQVQGATGGSLTLTTQFSNVGQPVNVTPPTDAKPLSELQKAIGQSGLGGLGGSGGASGSGSGGAATPAPGASSGGSGSGSAPSSDDFKKYADCLQKAGQDQAEAQKCSALIR